MRYPLEDVIGSVGLRDGLIEWMVGMTKCLIWGTAAEYAQDDGDIVRINSSRAGGKYRVTGTTLRKFSSLSTHQQKRLTTWLLRQRRAGIATPTIASHTFEQIETQSLMSFTDKVDAVLMFFGREIRRIGEGVVIAQVPQSRWPTLAAETESEDLDELGCLLHLMVDQRLLSVFSNHTQFSPAPAGWERIDGLLRQRTNSSQAFVAMWFNDATSEAFSQGIGPALHASGYEAVRIDKKEHNNKIDDEIVAEIRRSRFVVADFTCEPKSVRGGVYYEAGFAQGLGLPVIWTCKDSSLNDLHFDTRQYSHIVWKAPADLFEQLKNRIGATIGDGPLLRPK